jgi:Fic family protein
MRFPRQPPDLQKLLQNTPPEILQRVYTGQEPQAADKYLHWEEMRRREPPEGLTQAQWWLQTKLQRNLQRVSVPLVDSTGVQFHFVPTVMVQECLPRIDARTWKPPVTQDPWVVKEEQARYGVGSSIEEATTSSLLEGAATTRLAARDMIRQNRPPRTKGELMVYNNYETMEYLHTLKHYALTPKSVLDLHRRITENTWDGEDASGRYRRDDEEVRVMSEDIVLHVPPPAAQLPARMQAMCDFANGKTPERFVHPVLRAIILHFWLAYDHPFKDGNGRTARALFYWLMLRQGYWLFEYLSISSVLLEAPSRYARAFLFTETDANDLTYFIVYHLGAIEKAIEAMDGHVEEMRDEVRSVEARIHQDHDFNHRQLALLSHALRHPQQRYTLDTHRISHAVSRQTARNDFTALVAAGLLTEKRVSRRLIFRPVPDLAERLGER